jgi:hypothetical protein
MMASRVALVAALALSNCVRADVPAFVGFGGGGLGAHRVPRRASGLAPSGGSVTMSQDYLAGFEQPGAPWTPPAGYDPLHPRRAQGGAGSAGPAAEAAAAKKWTEPAGYSPASGSRGPALSLPREEGVKETEDRRRQIVCEIASKVEQIQQPGLGQYEILELNGLIVGLVGERVRLEARIIELGGPDYSQAKDRVVDIVRKVPADTAAAPTSPHGAQASKRWAPPEGYIPARGMSVEDAPAPAVTLEAAPSLMPAERKTWTAPMGYTPAARPAAQGLEAQQSTDSDTSEMLKPPATLAPPVHDQAPAPKKWTAPMGYVPKREASSAGASAGADDAAASSAATEIIAHVAPAPRPAKPWTAPLGYVPRSQKQSDAGVFAAGAAPVAATAAAAPAPASRLDQDGAHLAVSVDEARLADDEATLQSDAPLALPTKWKPPVGYLPRSSVLQSLAPPAAEPVSSAPSALPAPSAEPMPATPPAPSLRGIKGGDYKMVPEIWPYG